MVGVNCQIAGLATLEARRPLNNILLFSLDGKLQCQSIESDMQELITKKLLNNSYNLLPIFCVLFIYHQNKEYCNLLITY